MQNERITLLYYMKKIIQEIANMAFVVYLAEGRTELKKNNSYEIIMLSLHLIAYANLQNNQMT